MKLIILVRKSAPMSFPRGVTEMPEEMELVDEFPRCQQERSTRYTPSYEQHVKDKSCLHSARYVVDGRNLCKLHAGEAALAFLLNEG